MTANEVIKRFPKVVQPYLPLDIKKTIQYKIDNPAYVVLNHGNCSVHEGLAPDYDVAIEIKDEHLLAMFKGKLAPSMAFVTGKLRIEGDLTLAQKIPYFFDLRRIWDPISH